MLKPAQLRLLHEIAAHGQLQVAAERCAMTQPAASRMLAEVERQIGARLFLRQPKGMEPTEIGQSVLRRARVVLRELHSMASDVEEMQSGNAGSVRVGAVTGPAVGFLVSAIREIKKVSPRADISVEVQPSRDLVSQLAAGEMDFVLARILPDFDSRDFNIRKLRGETVKFVARSGHPMSRAAPVTLTELAEYEWIMQQRGAPIREATLSAFTSAGIPEPSQIVSTPSLLFTVAYLARSDAVSPVSEEMANLLILPPVGANFAVLKVPHDVQVPPYDLLSLRRRPLSPLAENLQNIVIRHAESAEQSGKQ